jgi:hypothetical protein
MLTGISAVIYLVVFPLPFPLARFYATSPPVDYAKLTQNSVGGIVAFVCGLLTLFLLYVWLLKWDLTPTLPAFTPYTGLIFALILFFSYPALAIDLLIYAVRARIWGLYGLNPLAAAPDSLPPTDPWAALAAEWGDIASPYGPLWETLSLGIFKLAGGHFLPQLFILKALAILSYLGCLFLLGHILSRFRPDWQQVGMFAFAWNPLVLLETAQNAHNDIIMVFFLLAAIWALVKGRDIWAMPLLALAVQIKFVPILLAPIFILHLTLKHPTWPGRIRAFMLHSFIFILLVILPLIPLWPGLENWAVLSLNSGAGRSLTALVTLALRPSLGLNLALDLSKLLLNGLFLAICLWFLWRRRQALSQIQTLIFLAWVIFFWYLLLAVPIFHAWYLLWSLPLAILLLPERKPLPATIAFSITALLIIPYFETVRIWYRFLLHNPLLGHAIGVPLLVLPPAVIALWRDKKRGSH